MCRELLSQCASEQLRTTTPAGDTALHLAARRRDVDMVRILVDYGTPIDMQNVRQNERDLEKFMPKDCSLLLYFHSFDKSLTGLDLKNIDHFKLQLSVVLDQGKRKIAFKEGCWILERLYLISISILH